MKTDNYIILVDTHNNTKSLSVVTSEPYVLKGGNGYTVQLGNHNKGAVPHVFNDTAAFNIVKKSFFDSNDLTFHLVKVGI